jgi:O-antigen/teichoic acid export membrane protein
LDVDLWWFELIAKITRQLLNRFRESEFWRNVAVLAGSTAIGQLLSVIITPFVTRLYKPEDFGLVAVYTSMSGFIAAVVCLSYQYAILPPDEDLDAANVLALCLLLAVGFSVVTVPVIYFWRGDIAGRLGEPRLACYLWLLPLSTLFIGFYKTFNFWATRREAFSHVAKTDLSRSIGSVIAKLGLGILGFRPLGLFIGVIMSEGIGMGSLLRLAWLRDQQIFRLVTFSGIKREFRRYVRFPLFTTPTALVNAAGTNLPVMLLATLYGTQVTGWFSLAHRLIIIPTTLVGAAVGRVYLGKITSLVHTNPEEMYVFFIKTVKRLIFISILLGFSFIVGGAFFIPLLFGREWNETGVYLQLLSFSFIAGFVATPVSQIFSLLERQDLAFFWNIIRFIVVTTSLCGAKLLELSARLAILLFSVSMMLVDVYRLLLVSRITRTTGHGVQCDKEQSA